MKKIILCIITLIMVSHVIGCSKTPKNSGYTKEDFIPYLKYGVLLSDIIDEFGEPDISWGDGINAIGYKMKDGNLMALNFGPRVFLCQAFITTLDRREIIEMLLPLKWIK